MSKITARSQKGQQVPSFTEDQAREFFEVRRWPTVAVCAHCGSMNVYRLNGKSHRAGLFECRECKEHFTVTVGTVMEDTHLPLSVWAKAFHYMASAKKGMSALQMQRNLGLGSYRTAWFLCHRIREAMRCEPVAGMLKGQVQVDEAYVGGKPRKLDGKIHKTGAGTKKTPVVVLVETNGSARSMPVENVDSKTLRAAMVSCVDTKAQIVTDEHVIYPLATAIFEGGHQTVNHSNDEYARKQFNNKTGKLETITTNTAESFFALLKRGHYGIFHQLSKKHLHRYCDEFSFRWNGRLMTDAERRDTAIIGAEGKRLYYKSPVGQ